MPVPCASTATRWIVALASAAALAVLAACGGDDGDDGSPPPAPPPPPVNAVPVASFVGATAVVVGMPLALDASASSDADSDPLTYSWDLGDGQRGGGQKIAAVFDSAGSFTLRLTVDDGRGGVHSVDQVVTVSAGPAALGAVETAVTVRDTAGALLAGVNVSVNRAGGASASTGADGRAALSTGRGIPVTLKFSKPGYADQFKTQTLPAAAESGYLQVTMLAREPALTLASAADGGELVGKDGVKLTFAPDSLVDAAGNPVSGPVQVSMTPVDVGQHLRAFPGKFEGLRPTGQQGLLVSYGTVEFALSADGGPVQLAAGKKATIEIPIYTGLKRNGTPIVVGDTFPIWSLNERTGGWTEEGVGTAVAAASPSDLALRAEVTHFSWWNHDDFEDPPSFPKPKCQVDTNLDGVPEDLSGTGYCWHEAVPELDDFAPAGVGRAHALASATRVRPLAEPRTRRIPAFAATATTPTIGGVALQIPADMNIVFRSWAKNGTLFGSKVVRLAAGVSEDVAIVLAPVLGDASGLNRINLPYDASFVQQTAGEVDRFVFAAEADAFYELSVVALGAGSTFSGSVTMRSAAGASLASGAFSSVPFSARALSTTTGDVTIELGAGRNAPGAYRIELRKVAGVPGGTATALPFPGSVFDIAIAGNTERAFELALAANDAVEIVAEGSGSVATRLAMFAPSGAQLASTTFADSAGAPDGVLRLAVAEPGTYRVVLTNTRTSGGTVSSLSATRIPLAATLTAPGSVTDTSATTGVANSRFYLVKSASSDPVAATLETGSITVTMRSWPDGAVASANRTYVRTIVPSAGLLPLLEVWRRTTVGAYTLGVSQPSAVPLNTDLALTTPAANALQVWRIDGQANQQLSVGWSRSPLEGIGVEPRLYAPGFGAEVVADALGIYTLPASGAYALVVSSPTPDRPFNFRVNDLAPPEDAALGTLFERSGLLALGEVKRYRFQLPLAKVMAMQLSSSGTLDASAVISGGNIRNASISLVSGSVAGRSAASPALYVREPEAATLSLRSSSNADGRSTGPFSLRLQAPTPVPANLGQLISITVQNGILQTYAFDVAVAGKHALCTTYAGSSATPLDSIVWGPSAPPFASWNRGDISTATPFLGAAAGEGLGDLRAGRQTLSVLSQAAGATATSQRLVALPAPVDITVGSSAVALSLAPCERRYLRFAGNGGRSYALRVTAGFTGNVYVRKQAVNGDWTGRTSTLGATPQPLAAGVERVVSFTIPDTGSSGGDGTYVIEVDGDVDAAGEVSVTLSTP
jgi:PKD domain